MLAEIVNQRLPENEKTPERWRTKWKSLQRTYLDEKMCSKSGELLSCLLSQY